MTCEIKLLLTINSKFTATALQPWITTTLGTLHLPWETGFSPSSLHDPVATSPASHHIITTHNGYPKTQFYSKVVTGLLVASGPVPSFHRFQSYFPRFSINNLPDSTHLQDPASRSTTTYRLQISNNFYHNTPYCICALPSLYCDMSTILCHMW